MTFDVKIIAGEVVPQNSLKLKEFTSKHEGDRGTLTFEERAKAVLHRFYRGAVLPYIVFQSETPFEGTVDAHRALKLEFCPILTTTLEGKRVKTADSFTGISKAKFQRFLDDVLDYMKEQGFEIPDSEAYNTWVDSSPLVGEEYPPLVRLKEKYATRIKALYPWR